MNVSELKARKGESVESAWKRLLSWVASLHVIPNKKVRIKVGKHGTNIIVHHRNKFRYPFPVSKSGANIKVGLGTINDAVPVIEKIRIDNKDEAGKDLKTEWPTIKMNKTLVGKDGSSYICLKVDPAGKGMQGGISGMTSKLSGGKPPEIVQCATPKPSVPDGFGYQPLAMLWMAEDKVTVNQIFQVTHHNLKYDYTEREVTAEELLADPTRRKVSRHIFAPR